MREAISLAGAACAIVGAGIVTLVPTADAAGIALALCGAGLAAWSLMRAHTSRTRCVGHNRRAGRVDFLTAQVEP